MDYTKFGRTGLDVSVIGMGCARLGATSRKGTVGDVLELLDRAFDSGVTFFDTADSYGQGKSEELIGRALKEKRDQVVLATKVGYRLSAAGGVAARFKPLVRPFVRSLGILRRSVEQIRSSQMRQDFSGPYIRSAVEDSLRRLRSDRIDLYQLHSPPAELLRTGEFIPVLEQLKAEGKIRYYGVSCLSTEDALLCLEHPTLSSVQVTINLFDRDAIGSLLPAAVQRGLAVIARQPLAGGILTGEPPVLASTVGSVGSRNSSRSAARYRFLERPGSRTVGQAAIRFVLQQHGVSTALMGISGVRHLEENVGAADAPPLTAEELARIENDAAG